MKPTQLRRSLFIGLGGTGMKTILKTKSVLLDNYGQNGELPPMLAFLGIDTDNFEYDKEVKGKKNDHLTLTPRERLSISVAKPKAYYDNYKREMQWMPPQNVVNIRSLDRGAGQVRSNGRLAFMYNREKLKDKLKTALEDVSSTASYSEKWKDFQVMESGIDGAAKIEVHIVFSLSGGTGSGTFLDVAYLVRELATETNRGITINGYAVLPGVFLSEIKDPAAKIRVEPNAYGALRELDYLMSIASDKRFAKISWKAQETDEMPFDSCILIDNKNTEGICYKKMSELTEMISLALLANTGQIGSGTMSIGDNIIQEIISKQFDVQNKCAWVSAIGTSAITYDSEHLAKVYELKVQNKLIREWLTYKQDVNVIANRWIDDVAEIRENKGSDQVIDCLYKIDQLQPPTLTDKLFDKSNVKAKVIEKIDLYNHSELSLVDWDKKVSDLYSKVARELIEEEKKLCKQSLSLSLDFIKEIKRQINDFFIVEMGTEIEEQRKVLTDADADFKSSIESLDCYLNQGIFHSKTRINNYLSQIKTYAHNRLTADFEIKRRTYADKFYGKLTHLIDDEINNLNETIKKLYSIVDDNDIVIRSLQNNCGHSHSVVVDLSEDIIKTVEVKQDAGVLLSNLIDRMPNKTLYVPDSTKETYKAVLDEFTAELKECEDIRSQTIDDILNDMSDEKFKDVIRRAANFSLPFLSIDGHGLFTQSTPPQPIGEGEIFYICVPQETTCRLTKEENFRSIFKAEKATPISTGLNDRIVIYRLKHPVPALAIGGLSTLKIPYERDQERVSFHIDEQLQKRMDEEEYSFQPKGQNQDEAIDAWVMGCILGFVKFDKGSYWYQDFTDESLGNEKENWKSTGSAYRETAFEQFSSNEQLINMYIDKFHTHIDDIGNLQAGELEKDVKDNYFRKYSRCQVTLKRLESSKEYIDTLKLIKKENEHRTSIFRN